MYAACSFVVGAAAGASALTHFAQVWIWVALAVWLVVATGTVRRGIEIARDDRQENEAAAPRTPPPL
jgi:uncharacterized membrane protein YoaK (UPF0700 family)